MVRRWIRRLLCRWFGHLFAGPPHDVYTFDDLSLRAGDGPLRIAGREGEYYVAAVMVSGLAIVVAVDRCTRCSP